MKAAVLTAYGAPRVLQVRELDKPSPGDGEILVRVRATTVTRGDTELRAFDLPWLFWIPLRLWLGVFGPRAHKIMGMEYAGVVEAVGTGVEQFAVGDAVYGTTSMGLGAYAEYVRVPASGVVARKPEGVSFAQVAALGIGGLAALGYLHKGAIKDAPRVLVRGASGSIGSYAVQLAKYFGAHVTGVCPPDGVQALRRLGADVVIDYTAQDFSEGDARYDLILDVVGKVSISRCLRILNDRGRYVRATIPGVWELLRALWTRVTSTKRVIMGDAGESAEDLALLGELLQSGKLETVIDRSYPLEEIAGAHEYVERGHKKGNVIIDV